MLSYAIILNRNDPVGFAGGNLASISLRKTNKQNQRCIFILTQHKTVPEVNYHLRSEALPLFWLPHR